MASRPLFSRAHAWWSWDHADIVRAVRGAWLEHLLPLVTRTVQANAAAGRSPDRVEAICRQVLIRRHPRNFERVLAGNHNCSDGFRLALATALGVSVKELFPANSWWIAHATCRLCRNGVTTEDAAIYGELRTANGSSNGRTSTSAEQAIERVIAVLEPLLEKIDRELRERER